MNTNNLHPGNGLFAASPFLFVSQPVCSRQGEGSQESPARERSLAITRKHHSDGDWQRITRSPCSTRASSCWCVDQKSSRVFND